MGVNKVILVGNVGRDPEVRTIASGTRLAKFSLATTDHRSKDQDGNPRTEWHNIVVWAQLADFCERYVKKGTQLYVEGSIRYDTYEKDGQKKYFTEINAREIQFVGPKQSGGDSGGSGGGNRTDTGSSDGQQDPGPSSGGYGNDANEPPF